MKRTVCLDTNIIIWGILGEGRSGDKNKKERAEYLLQHLEGEKARVVIPAIILAEVTAKMREEDKQELVNALIKHIEIIDFCTKSALEYASVRALGMKRKGKNFSRKEITVDSMIVACCKANRVNEIYTDDGNLKSIAKNFMAVPELPVPPSYQLPLLPPSA